jgi:hypothetical protein
MTFCKKLFVPAVITLWAALGSGVLSAQSSGVGCDGYTRFLWRGTDSRISLWRVDSTLNAAISHQYGPYDGWEPIAMTVLCNNYTYVLWKNTNGSISLWKVDPNLNFVTYRQYGPYAGWIPESLSPSPGGNLRVLWRETQGMISIWVVDSNLNFSFNKVYGPFFGFDPTAAGLAARVARPADASSQEATEAMKEVNTGFARMPE